MTVKNIILTITGTVIVSGVGAFIGADKAVCGIVRDDGRICQKIAGGRKTCEQLGYEYDSKKKCCKIN